MKKIISYFLSGIVLCTALLVTPVSAAEVAPAEETITINSTVSVRATNYWTKTTTKLILYMGQHQIFQLFHQGL